MKLIAILLFSLTAAVWGQSLAPRSLYPQAERSKSGYYVVTFPPPNECVGNKPIAAVSREDALYRFVSRGGFTLKPGVGSLTVWTLEEWNQFKTDDPEFWAQQVEHCK